MGGKIAGWRRRGWKVALLTACLGGMLTVQSSGVIFSAEEAAPATEQTAGSPAAAPEGGSPAERAQAAAPAGQGGSLSLRERLKQAPVDIFFAEDIIEPLFDLKLDEWQKLGYKEVQGVNIVVPAGNYSKSGGGKFEVKTGIGGRADRALTWTDEESWLEYQVNIPKSGLYNIGLEYYPLPGKRASIQRDIKIDGEYPFNEARRILFTRFFKDANLPEQDNQGNDVRPRQLEVPQWSEVLLEGPQGMYEEPLLFYFSEGRHTIRITAIREPIAFTHLRIVSPEHLPTYADVQKEYAAKGYKEVKDVVVKFQAEWPVLKSDPTIRAEFGFDPEMEPKSEGNYRLNEFGSWRWRQARQFATWKFTVPEDGLYKIGFKVWQGWGDRMPSIREVYIDGEVPFAELRSFQFPYDKYWRITALADEEENPYLFYLTKGEHTLKMRAMGGPIASTIRFLKDRIQQLAIIAREITMITGPNPDPNMDWEVYEKIPNLLPDLTEMAEAFTAQAGIVREYAGTRPRLADQLLMTASQLRNMVRYPETIQNRLGEISGTEQQLGSWVLNLQNHPLSMDYILVAAPSVKFPSVRAPALDRFNESMKSFLASFHKNYTGVGSIYETGAQTQDLVTLWVGRGREWALIMKDMIEEDFTPTTGIRVNVNVIPANQLNDTSQMAVIILASSSGKAPDLASGVPASLPVEFAIRGGVVDVSKFSTYQQVIDRFRPGALIPFQWKGGLYAIPETQGFSMQFYRVDILGQFGLEPADTWTDVISMLPTLQQYGTNYYYPAAVGNFTPILYQYGGEYYTEDGSRSALDTPSAYEAFKLWTSFYANFRVPIEASFYTRMRTGEIPIGVADYSNYVLLSTAAPELTGWWVMEPIPGVQQQDGTIDRTTGGYADTGVIFSSSKKQEQAFKLLDWWTSAPIQSRYAQELEALIGAEARWNTANVEALFGLPWPQRDIRAIREQFRWFKEQPIVLGGYFTGRHLTNAWNKVVLEGKNPREALEDAVKAINRELQRKQEEFGVFIDQKPVAVIQAPTP